MNVQLNNSLLYHILSFYFSFQQKQRKHFSKLTTEIELVEISKQILHENENPFFNQYFAQFNDNSFVLIKILDNSNIVNSIIKNLDLIYELPLKDLIAIENCFFGVISHQEYSNFRFFRKDLLKTNAIQIYSHSQFNQNQITDKNISFFIFPSQIKNYVKKGEIIITLRILNSVFINNSIVFKSISSSNLKQIENQSLKISQLVPIYFKLTSLCEIVEWNDFQEVELLMFYLNEMADYKSEEQEYKTVEDYFEIPDSNYERIQVMNRILQSNVYEYGLSPNMKLLMSQVKSFKQPLTIIVINGMILCDRDVEKQIENSLIKLYQSNLKKQTLLIAQFDNVRMEEQEEFLEDLRKVCMNSQVSINSQRMESEYQNPSLFIEKGCRLFFEIQRNLKKEIVPEKESQEYNYLIREFKQLMVRSFIIKKI